VLQDFLLIFVLVLCLRLLLSSPLPSFLRSILRTCCRLYNSYTKYLVFLSSNPAFCIS
jgi:hypothetical protein